MGVAVTKVSMQTLAKLMQLPENIDIIAVAPPGLGDMSQRNANFVLEGPEFPVVPKGMNLPLVYPMYLDTADGPEFKGFQHPGERSEPFYGHVPS